MALTGGSLTVGDGTESENILVTGGASYSLGTTIIPYSSSTTINVQVVGTESNFGKLYLLNDDIFPSDGSVSLNLSGTQGSFHPGAYSNTIGQLTGNGGLATVASGFLTINGGNYSGEMDGEGVVIISGGGTLTFATGFSSIATGPIIIDSGATLEIEVSNSGSSLAAFTVDGTMNLNSNSWDIGSLDGSGGTVSIGSGGVLTVTGGSVQEPYDLNITGSGVLNIASSGAVDIAGETFQLSGVSTSYLGELNVFLGICQINDGAILGSVSNTSADSVSQGATLTVDGALYCGTLQDSGTVSIGSTGVISCTTLTVASTGTLAGCGTIYGTVTNDGGSLETGCSVSPLTINGDYLSLPDSILSPSLDGSSIATLLVSGDATLDERVALILRPEPDCYEKSHDYAVLTTGGSFSGTFAEVEMGTYFLVPSLSYGPQGVGLTVTRTPIRNFATGDNTAAVAEALDSLADSGKSAPCSAVKKLFFSSPVEIEKVLESMDPALFKGLTLSQENNAVKVRETLSYRMQDVLNRAYCWDFSPEQPSEQPKEKSKIKSQKTKETPKTPCKNGEKAIHLWIDGFGDFLYQNNITYAGSPQIGYQTNTGGGVVGLDYHFAKYCYVGALGAYTGSGTEWNDQFGKGTINTAYAGLYFSAIGEMFYGNISVIGGWSHFTGHRNILFPDETLTANNGHGGDQILSHVDTGINFGFKGFTIRPFDSLDYICGVEHSFTERGAGEFDLHLEKSNAIMLRNELGLQLSSCFCLGSSKWTFAPSLSWVREIRIKGSTYTASFVGTDVPFEVTGYFPNRNLISPGVLLSGMLMDDFLSLDLYYNGEFATKYSDNNFGGQIRFGF